MGEWKKEGKCCCTGSQLRVRIYFNLHTYNVSGSLNAVRRRTLEFGRKIRIQARPRAARERLQPWQKTRHFLVGKFPTTQGKKKKLGKPEGKNSAYTCTRISSCKMAERYKTFERYIFNLQKFVKNTRNIHIYEGTFIHLTPTGTY